MPALPWNLARFYPPKAPRAIDGSFGEGHSIPARGRPCPPRTRRECRGRSLRRGKQHALLVVLRRARRFLAVDVPVIPREVALVAVADVARARDTVELVELVRVDHQLCVDAEGAQRLIHLLPALHWHVEIALAAEEERRRHDAVGVQE